MLMINCYYCNLSTATFPHLSHFLKNKRMFLIAGKFVLCACGTKHVPSKK